MNAFQLKLLAIISMVIAHAGLFFFGDPLWMYAIGRLAFPLFAFLLAIGARHTKNASNYLRRLLIFGVISQVPFIFASRIIDPSYWVLNIFFTLFLGLLAIEWTKNKKPFLKITIISIFFIAGYVLGVDYGGLGVLSVVAFYYFTTSRIKTVISQFVIFSFIQLVLLITIAQQNPQALINPLYFIPYATLSLIPIFFYTGKEGRRMKYLFYVFYPLQYVVIFILLQYM